MAELQLGLEEIRLEPVDSGIVESVRDQRLGGWPGDASACCDDLFILLFDDGIADAGVSGRHLCTAMAEDGHDRLNAGATFGKLSAYGVTEPVRGHGRTALAIDEPGLAAGNRQWFFKQIVPTHGLAAKHKYEPDGLARRRVVAGGSIAERC